jgi:hypothetical protein
MMHFLWMHDLLRNTPQENAARQRRLNMKHAACWMVYVRATMGNAVARWEGWG